MAQMDRVFAHFQPQGTRGSKPNQVKAQTPSPEIEEERKELGAKGAKAVTFKDDRFPPARDILKQQSVKPSALCHDHLQQQHMYDLSHQYCGDQSIGLASQVSCS